MGSRHPSEQWGEDIDRQMKKWGLRWTDNDIVLSALLSHHLDDYEKYKREGREDAAEGSKDDLIELLDLIEWNLDHLESAFVSKAAFHRFASRFERVPGIGT